jgi:hypothetical protein
MRFMAAPFRRNLRPVLSQSDYILLMLLFYHAAACFVKGNKETDCRAGDIGHWFAIRFFLFISKIR